MATRFRRAIFTLLVALGLAAGLQAATAAPASAQEQVDISVFQDSLAPYGHWFQHPQYGWAWQPTAVEPGWRPYTHGHWLWTDEYGWYWNSDYEWGWAPFHYGRWAFDNISGWFWVPGSVWGPAWVAWRSGDGYTGWAPMPPEAAWQGGGFGGPSINIGFAPAWTFVEDRYLADPRPVFVPVERNETFIRQTTNVTNYVTVNNRIVDRSVDVHRIEAASNTRITPVHVRDVDRPEMSGGRQAAGGEVHVFRPKVAARQQGQPGFQGTQEPARVPEPVMRNQQNLETQKQQREVQQQKQQRAIEEQKQQRAIEEQKQQRAIEQQKQQRAVEQHQQRAIEQQKQQRAIEQQQQQGQPQPTKHQEEQNKQQKRRQQQCQENPSSC